MRILRLFAERYQQFPSGLTHFTNTDDRHFRPETYRPRVLPVEAGKTEWEKVHEKSEGLRADISRDYFLHCYFESAANIMTGVNEMLLQSHDDVIRVFPATEEYFTGLFTLCAAGGFTVTSEMSEGDIRFVHIRSVSNRICKIESPWPGAAVSVICGGKSIDFTRNGTILEWGAVTGGEYLIIRCEYPLDCYYREDIRCDENTLPKEWRGKTIGRFSSTKGRAKQHKKLWEDG
jgi:hypothetical protein